MSHTYHEKLPGYDPDQLLHDGCQECESRAKSPTLGIVSLDPERFAHAWTRAARWQQHGLDGVSHAEEPPLLALWAVQVQLERIGHPIGTLPQSPFEAVQALAAAFGGESNG